jgi:hypothetical protein
VKRLHEGQHSRTVLCERYDAKRAKEYFGNAERPEAKRDSVTATPTLIRSRDLGNPKTNETQVL